MTLLQLKIDDKLSTAIKEKAVTYGVPASSLIRIVLIRSFLENNLEDKKTAEGDKGNIFNASRDNNGKGIKIDDLIAML